MWTTSGNNRAILWNIQSGERCCSVNVNSEIPSDVDVELNCVPIRVMYIMIA